MFRHFLSERRAVVRAMVWGAMGWTLASGAQAAPRVQVRGSSRVELRAVGPSQQVRVSGSMHDEVGAPIADASIMLSAVVGADTPLDWQHVRSCNGRAMPTGAPHAEHPVQTDDYGAFCIEGELAGRAATIRAVFGGDALHEGTHATARWDADLQSAALAFAPRPERIDLDAPRVVVFGQLTAPAGVSVAQREVTLSDDHARVLGSGRTDDAGMLHIDVASSTFDGPGIGGLKLRFDGGGDLTPAEDSVSVVRVGRVQLRVDTPELRGDPAAGIGLLVRATTTRGAVDGGTVEVTWGSASVGAARVVDGQAHVVAMFAPSRDTRRTELLVRYSPEAPYYESGPSVPIMLTVAYPRMWWRVLPVLGGLAVAAWLLRGWRRPLRRAEPPTALARRAGEASLAVVGSAKDRGTWSGKVVDAHDGEPIAGAVVRVIAPSFGEVDVVAQARASAQGRFEFRIDSGERDLRLRVEDALHTQIERALPPASDMVIAMVSRRRALLERLVSWARRAGRPWDRPPEPTPGHVASVAAGQRQPREDIGRWARRVEQRAYGPEAVDAAAEREVMDIEPGGPPVR